VSDQNSNNKGTIIFVTIITIGCVVGVVLAIMNY